MREVLAKAILGAALVLPMCTATPASAQGSGPYEPEQIYFLLHEAVREALGVDPADPNQPYWLSLSTVGSVVSPHDKGQVNAIADFCPPPTPVIAAYGLEPPLHEIYDRVVLGMVGPQRTYSKEYYEARAFLQQGDQPSNAVKKYNQYEKAYVRAWADFLDAPDAGKRALAAQAKKEALEAWRSLGFRNEVESARAITTAEESRAGFTRFIRRRQVLDNYIDQAFAGTDAILGAYLAPVSELSPPPSRWDSEDGWTRVAYSAATRIHRYSKEQSTRSGFAGLSLGFVTIGARGGSTTTTEARLNEAFDLSYEFELKRVRIHRPWLDTSVFFEPADWTWKKIGNTPKFPYVAVDRTEFGTPAPSETSQYDNRSVACALLPLELVIARKRMISATVSKADYQRIDSSGELSGAVGLFGIFGGVGQGSTSATKIREDGQTVTFVIESQGLAVVGLISQFLPRAPNPNRNDSWPATAWLPDALP